MAISSNNPINAKEVIDALAEKANSSHNHDSVYLKLSGGTCTGNITAPGFYVDSLKKLKENITPTIIEAVNLINSQEIVDFNYINDPNKQHKIGLIADDSDPLFLNIGKEKVDLYNTCGILMKAIQELSAKVEFLEKQILEIKGE